jgi:hypothetical protein
MQCTPCGQLQEPCCQDGRCDAKGLCIDNTCLPCGKDLQSCCKRFQCDEDNYCYDGLNGGRGICMTAPHYQLQVRMVEGFQLAGD